MKERCRGGRERDIDQLLEQISFMLLIDWDPLGIHVIAEVQDAYDRVAARLISMIEAGAEVSALADYLVAVETQEFGLPGRPDRALAVAMTAHHFATWKPILPITGEFVYLARCFHQDMMYRASTEEGLVGGTPCSSWTRRCRRP